jgi:outer membrane PBP1 activator LpoA protein
LKSSQGSKHSFSIPTAIALLLPESGRYAKAAQVIKDGFMTAYHQSQSNFQPSIRFYDSSMVNPVSLYHQVIAEGAELVIGPLSKDNIQNLALGTELTIPVLALNHIPNLAKDNLFQFGLSPIDGAKQATTKASLDGHKKALILTPETNQGRRINEYLTEYWQQTGGTILESQSYDAKESDFSKPIKDLLNLDESRYRYNRLKRLLAKDIKYTERRRQDIDAILLSASAKKARSIYPQLRFYRATRVPVYATPNIYSGLPNPSLDIDLNNITFCDIPWLFPSVYTGELSQESLRNQWQFLPRKYLRLLALGIDSFNIITHLEQINLTPYPGATGKLSINMENRITRQLVCAKFIKGIPVIQDSVFEEYGITNTFVQ